MSAEWTTQAEINNSAEHFYWSDNTGSLKVNPNGQWQFKEIVFPNLIPSPTPSFPQISFAPITVKIDPEELLKDEAFVKRLGAALLKTLGKEQIAELIGDAPTVKPGRRVVRE